jgi:polyhydroxyalkanoate synthesis regulator phasin
MAKDQDSYYSGLAGLLDATVAVSEQQGKATKNEHAAVNFFGALSDIGLNEYSAAAAMLGANFNAENIIKGTAYGWVNNADQANINYASFKTEKKFGTTFIDAWGNVLQDTGVGTKIDDVGIGVNATNAINTVFNASGVAEDAAKGYIQQLQDVRKLKMIAGVGNIAQKTAAYWAAKTAGIDGDIRAFGADVINNNRLFTDDNRNHIYAEMLTMVAGVTDAKQRAIFANEINDRLAEKARVEKHNTYDYESKDHKSVDYNLGNIFSKELADPKLDPAKATQRVMEARMSMTTLINSVGDPTLQAQLITFVNSKDFDQFAKLAAAGTIANGVAEGRLASYSLQKLASAYSAQGDYSRASAISKYTATLERMDGQMALGDYAAYMKMRMDNLNKNAPAALNFLELGLVGGGFFRLAGALGTSGNSGTKTGDFLGAVAGKMKNIDSGAAKDFKKDLDARVARGAMTQDEADKRFAEFLKNQERKRVDNLRFYKKDPFDPIGDSRLNAYQKQLDQMVADGKISKQEAAQLMNDYKNSWRYQLWKSDIKNLNWAGTTDLISHDANRIQRGLYIMGTLHPTQFIYGMFSGTTLQRLMWIGSNYGKTTNINEMSWYARGAARILNSKIYQTVIVKNFLYLNYLSRLPVIALNKAAKAPVMVMKGGFGLLGGVVSRIPGVNVLTRIFGSVFSKVVGVLGGPLGAVYGVLNTITGGLLDKILGQAIQKYFEFVLLCIVGGGVLLCGLSGGFDAFETGPTIESTGLSTPDKSFNPIATGGGYGDYIDTPVFVDLGDYNAISMSECPFIDSNVTSGFSCSQGPYGAVSHACSSFNIKEPAIDVTVNPGGIYAPADGVVIRVGDMSCGSGGPSIGGVVVMRADDGTEYGFYHVATATTVGARVSAGALIAVMSRDVPVSECWSGPHVHAYVKDSAGKYVDAQKAYQRFCGNFTCSIGDTNSGGGACN